MTDPFDPINMAARHLFNAGQVEAQANRIEQLQAQVAALKAEVERLRKAGDALVGEGETMAHDVSWVPCVWDNRVADWNAAKEGKPTL